MALKRTSEIPTGSSYFKPKDYEKAHVLLFEPKAVQREVPNDFNGVKSVRDEVTADVTVFVTAADLANGNAVELKSVQVTHKGIVNRLTRALAAGDDVVGRLGMKKFEKSPAPAWVIDEDNDVDEETFAQVVAYYEAREKAVQEALASVPDFD